MALEGSPRDHLILTNNPLVPRCMEGKGQFTIRFLPELDFRQVLVLARDMVYAGHTLYTHPLAGSVKPNETPYKSVVVSVEPHGFNAQMGEIMANAIAVYDKFTPIGWELNERILSDFQLIDYTLLAGSLHFDAAAGISNLSAQKTQS